MVRRLVRNFRRNEDGVVMVEALLTMPIVILMMVAVVEIGMAVFQWNLTVKALQVGARLAAVSSPIVGDVPYGTLDDDFAALVPGDAVPSTIQKVSCGADTTPCNSAALTRLMTGGDDCGTTVVGGTNGICDVAAFIRPENIRITYYRAGLGYVGRPFGTVSNITLEIRNQNFDFLFLDQLIPILGTIPIPSHPVSMTSEDISDCIDVCP